MNNWFFNIMMFLLAIVCIVGAIFFIISKLAIMLAIVIFLSPFAIIIYFKIKQIVTPKKEVKKSGYNI